MHAHLSLSPSRPNFCSANAPANYTATNSSTTMLAVNEKRQGLVITNIGDKKIYLAFGSHAAVKNKGIFLDKKTGVFGIDATMCCKLPVQVITENGTSTVAIQEFERLG